MHIPHRYLVPMFSCCLHVCSCCIFRPSSVSRLLSWSTLLGHSGPTHALDRSQVCCFFDVATLLMRPSCLAVFRRRPPRRLEPTVVRAREIRFRSVCCHRGPVATPAPARQRRGSGSVISRGAARRSQAAWSSSRAGLSNLPPTTGLESTQESGRPNGWRKRLFPTMSSAALSAV